MSPILSACHSEHSEGSAALAPLVRAASLAAILAAISLLLFTGGCAVPGEPLPPLLDIPSRISGITAQQIGSELRIKVPVPQLTTEGTRPRSMEKIELYVEIHPGGTVIETTSSAEPKPIHVWSARDIASNPTEFSYEIDLKQLTRDWSRQPLWVAAVSAQAFNHRGSHAGISDVVFADVVNLPRTPTGLAAVVSENNLTLNWTGFTESIFGAESAEFPALEYEIFRSPDTPVEAALEKVGQSKSTTFADSSILFGQSYRYAVRAIYSGNFSISATPLSTPIKVVALDRFPPAPPAGLRAIAVTGAVELAWSPGAEADLAGYNIYREMVADDAPAAAARVKLNASPLDIPLFRDASVDPATQYRYQVTAVDRDGNEGTASNEETVETE